MTLHLFVTSASCNALRYEDGFHHSSATCHFIPVIGPNACALWNRTGHFHVSFTLCNLNPSTDQGISSLPLSAFQVAILL